MPLDLLSAVSPLAPFLLFVDDVLYGAYRNRRREKEAFVLHLKRVITLLESTSTSADDAGSDVQWILTFQTRLARILEDLGPRHRSIVHRVRARWIYDEKFIYETNREIDTVLRLVELRAVVSLNGGLISLRGGMEHLLSMSNNPTFQTAPGKCTRHLHDHTRHWHPIFTHSLADAPLDNATFPVHNGTCRCAANQGAPKHGDFVHEGSDFDTTVQPEPQGFGQILGAAYQNVMHHRHLAQQDQIHRPCLVKALDLLVQLLRRAGRVSEALQYSLEANRLLGVMAQAAS